MSDAQIARIWYDGFVCGFVWVRPECERHTQQVIKVARLWVYPVATALQLDGHVAAGCMPVLRLGILHEK